MRQLYKFFNHGNKYYREFTDRLENSSWKATDYYKEAKRVRKLLPTLPSNERASAYEYMHHCQSKRIEIFNNQQVKK
ncbi:MAG: hypothetical protein EKK57_02740 [Proteobacteria bacterium]|nr:MAG: hypothetical protein EKK57_02740 [Pseudomonadota bacterium]